MSAETLHRAAHLMRERAEAATPGPWRNMRGAEKGESVVANASVIAQMHTRDKRENRRHIASWHPEVALAVALLLDNEAFAMEASAARELGLPHDYNSARARLLLDIARTYLGESA